MFLFDLFNKNNAIFKAVKSNNVAQLHECIQQGISVNYAKSNGQTPLMYAAQIGNLQMVQHLLGIGADANRTDKNNVNALAYAATDGHLAIVEYLAPKTSDLNMALSEAIRTNHPQIVRYLVDKVPNLNVLSQYGITFLFDAVDNLEIVKILVEAGADVNCRGYDSEMGEITPLMEAVTLANIEVVKYLVENGADVNAKYKEGKVLDCTYFSDEPEFDEIRDYLISKGATY